MGRAAYREILNRGDLREPNGLTVVCLSSRSFIPFSHSEAQRYHRFMDSPSCLGCVWRTGGKKNNVKEDIAWDNL